MKRFLGFTLAGLVGGFIVGLLDASAAGREVLGLDALIGAALGAVTGLFHPLIPMRLQALALLRAAFARLRPGAHDALHDRCRTLTGLWILALGLPLLLFALETVEPLLLGRVRSRILAALAVALLGLALVGLALALAAPLLAGLARALETLVRRRPALTPFTRPDVHCGLALAVGLALTRPGLPSLPLLAAALLLGITLLGGELSLRGRARLLLLGLGCGLAVAAALAWPLRTPAARAELADAPALGALLRAARPPASPEQPGP